MVHVVRMFLASVETVLGGSNRNLLANNISWNPEFTDRVTLLSATNAMIVSTLSSSKESAW